MSTALAVAAVSFTLVDLLNNGLIDRDISAQVGDVAVTALSPDQIDTADRNQSQLNLFLYNVTQNEAWRNTGYPARDPNGDRINNPVLALNLHYLLTAYGAAPFHAEILLGYGMQLLHETPVLPRDAIRHSLLGPTQVTATGNLPSGMLNLFTSQLAEQVEQIKIWPQMLSTEEISRLWTAFQAKYRPTAAYQASVVLIESEASTRQALPVAMRGVRALAAQKPVVARLLTQRALPNAKPAEQPIVWNDTLVLQGSNLHGDATLINFGTQSAKPSSVKVAALTVSLPPGLFAGPQVLTVEQTMQVGSPPEDVPAQQSDPVSFILRPLLDLVSVQNLSGSGLQPRSGTMHVELNPVVAAQQQVKLLLNLTPSPATGSVGYSFSAPPPTPLLNPPGGLPDPVDSFEIPFSGVKSGTYLVRVSVDGVESVHLNTTGALEPLQVVIA